MSELVVEVVRAGAPATISVVFTVDVESCVFIFRDLNAKTEARVVGTGSGKTWLCSRVFGPGVYHCRANGVTAAEIEAVAEPLIINVPQPPVVDYEAVTP